MALPLQQLKNAALELAPEERLRLASALIDSVEGPAPDEWSEVWSHELHQRSSAADAREARGESRGADWSGVRARLMKGLDRQ